MKTSIFASAFILFVAASTSAFAVSFDCRKASTSVEGEICSNPGLGTLDDSMAHVFKILRGAKLDPEGAATAEDQKLEQIRLVDEQKNWMKHRNSCTNSKCLTDSYNQRLTDLCESYWPAVGKAAVCVGAPGYPAPANQ